MLAFLKKFTGKGTWRQVYVCLSVSSWQIYSACFEGTVLSTRITVVPDAYAQCTHQFLTHMRSIRISSWRICSAHASVPDVYAQRMHQFLTRMLRVYKMNIWEMEKLMCMLSMLVRKWCLWSGYILVPDMHAQCKHHFLSRMLIERIKVRAFM